MNASVQSDNQPSGEFVTHNDPDLARAIAARNAALRGERPEPAPEPKPAVVLEPEPAPEPPPATDVRAELDALKQQLSAMSGRVVPLQQLNASQQAALVEAERLRQEAARREQEYQNRIAALEQAIAAKAVDEDPASLLSDEERQFIDKEQLSVITKVSAAAAKRIAVEAEAKAKAQFEAWTAEAKERDRKAKLQEVFNDAKREFPLTPLQSLAEDEKFKAWLNSDEGQPTNVILNNLVSARIEDMDRLARIAGKSIKKYTDMATGHVVPSPAPEPDPNTRLQTHAKRGSNGRFAENDLEEKVARAKRLVTSSNPADLLEARKLLNEIRAQPTTS